MSTSKSKHDAAVTEILNLLSGQGFSLEEAEQVLSKAKDFIRETIEAPSFERASEPLASFVSGYSPKGS